MPIDIGQGILRKACLPAMWPPADCLRALFNRVPFVRYVRLMEKINSETHWYHQANLPFPVSRLIRYTHVG